MENRKAKLNMPQRGIGLAGPSRWSERQGHALWLGNASSRLSWVDTRKRMWVVLMIIMHMIHALVLPYVSYPITLIPQVSPQLTSIR